jgi:hypothetical protein
MINFDNLKDGDLICNSDLDIRTLIIIKDINGSKRGFPIHIDKDFTWNIAEAVKVKLVKIDDESIMAVIK